MTQKELDNLQEKALAQLKSGESLFGKDGAFAPMPQSCIVHQIRNSLKYVASKDQKEFMRDLKRVPSRHQGFS